MNATSIKISGDINNQLNFLSLMYFFPIVTLLLPLIDEKLNVFPPIIRHPKQTLFIRHALGRSY